jgi:t-SNARE complex subunit (syntaxin)
MGEFMMALMACQVILGGIMSGMEAAQKECQNEQDISDTRQQIADLAQTMTTAIDELNQLDNVLQDQINDVQLSTRQVVQKMILSKRDFAIFVKKMQLCVACIIIIVFILLLGKKMKMF